MTKSMNDLEITFEYCSVCEAEHTMLDGGDIYDCWNYYRMNVEDEETKRKKEERVEVWDMKTKTWKKKKYVSNAV